MSRSDRGLVARYNEMLSKICGDIKPHIELRDDRTLGIRPDDQWDEQRFHIRNPSVRTAIRRGDLDSLARPNHASGLRNQRLSSIIRETNEHGLQT